MVKVFRYGVLTMVVVATALASYIVNDVSARSDGSSIVISWNTDDEQGVQRFDVLRRAGASGDFAVIGSKSAMGKASTYTFTDQSVFKAEAGVYQYRIRVINGQSPAPETEIVTVSHLSSTARRTWGSIKAMFR